MSTAAQDPRGAGTGEEAVATRDRQPEETVYPKGDIQKGRIDFEKQAEGQNADQIAMRDRRAYLINQAEKNEAANDELNAIQVEQNKKLPVAQGMNQDPDVQRSESMETAINALKAGDPDTQTQAAEPPSEEAPPPSEAAPA